ncbi:MAG: AAA family ATPase [Proteobacteria bacterium]|nr:AAA family ATPase [Pseudomonadota bacterium]
MAPSLSKLTQQDVVAFLKRPESHGLDRREAVRCVQTHGAMIFLAGQHAYKLKRDVRLPYLDFSTIEKRRLACENEVRLNRRTAPTLYHGVVAIERQADGQLTIGAGGGETVDWLVRMRRFPDDALLSRIVAEGSLSPRIMRDLADTIADFHRAAEKSSAWGGADELLRIAKGNADRIAHYTPQLFEAERAKDLAAATLAAVAAHRELLEWRRANGFVRHGHGDLHLANIYLDDGRPRLFDAIEFDDRLAQNDVLYDLAFLLMDLWHRDLAGAANRVFSRYLLRTGDMAGLGALPLFLSLRAGVRAHVTATMAAGSKEHADLRAEAAGYLDLAIAVLRPRPPVLLAVGGFSGSGKSHLAAALAPLLGPVPGAVHLRSDELRKVLLGQDPEAPLGPSAYTSAVSAQVYEQLRQRAGQALLSGHAVVADAVHNHAGARDALAGLAAQSGVPFIGLWLDADPALMAQRITARHGDASDADAAVMQEQVAAGAGPVNWHRIDAALPQTEKIRQIKVLLGEC